MLQELIRGLSYARFNTKAHHKAGVTFPTSRAKTTYPKSHNAWGGADFLNSTRNNNEAHVALFAIKGPTLRQREILLRIRARAGRRSKCYPNYGSEGLIP